MCFLKLLRIFIIILLWTVLPGITFISSISAQSVADMMDNTPGAYWNTDGCSGFRKLFNNDSGYKEFTREKALRTARAVLTNPDWKKYLPCCPENINLVNDRDWKVSNQWDWQDPDLEGLAGRYLLDCFHLNALNCIRSKNYSGKINPGQQCCYNNQGDLIRSGLGAGTPDLYSPSPSRESHKITDVWPWTKLSLKEYHAAWTPNQGCNSPFRVIVKGNLEWTYAYLWVKRGDTIILSDAKGTVVWGENGNSSSPEGSNAIADAFSNLGRDMPKIAALPGSLIAMIYIGRIPDTELFLLNRELISAPAFIGKGDEMEVLRDGLLFLGVNDVNPANNSGYFDVEVRRIR